MSSYMAAATLEKNTQLMHGWEVLLEKALQGELPDESPIVYSGYVTGLSHHEYSRSYGRLSPGKILRVQRDKDNKYDALATGLFLEDQQIGWVPKALNRITAKAIDIGLKLHAVITKHNPDTSNPFNVLHVLITVTPESLDKYRNTFSDLQTKPQEQQTMKTAKAILEQNINLGTSAAFLEAGRIANNQLSGIASKKLPIMVRAYADTPMGRLLLANVALMAREHFRPNDERLSKLCNAMAVSAYQEVLQSFDIEQMIEDLVENKTIAKALKTFDAEPAES